MPGLRGIGAEIRRLVGARMTTRQSPSWFGRPVVGAVLGLTAAALLLTVPAWGDGLRLSQFRSYSASGTHRCEKSHSCAVTGFGFSNCNDASITLKTRDCCSTSAKGGASSGFVLNYCLPDRPL